jgi:hypothetical protein
VATEFFPEKDRPFYLWQAHSRFFSFSCRQVSKFRQKKITVANPLTYLTKLKKQNKTVATILFFVVRFWFFKIKN